MYKRLWSFIMIGCLLAGLWACPAGAWADSALKSAPLTSGNTRNGMVRVRLSSLGNPATLNLTVQGSYSVNGQPSRALPSGTKATVHFNASTGQLSFTSGGSTSNMGASFSLRRHETIGPNGIKIAQGRIPDNLYPGDLTFTVRNNSGAYTLYVIASIYMEDYLYGVLPYEMGNSSGLEALKAQAVAARTYTLRAMAASSSTLYDVVDTTGDQVYSGTPSGNANCVIAVDQTKGIALKNGSSFTATYYTASNGGQTESIKNAWGTTGNTYLIVKDDPYDLANPESRKVSFSVTASGSQKNSVLGSLLNEKASQVFGSGATVTGVSAVTPHSPKYAVPSRLYTKLDFDVTYTRGGQSATGTLTFDIFSELEGPLSMSINTGSNELWSVSEAVGGFLVTARRYGHGIGLSQRGAMQMAKMGYTYDQILAFYFEGCTRVQYTLTRSVLSSLSSGQSSQEQVIEEPPAPIENPDAPTVPVPDGTYARVTTASGSLNLRASASGTAKVLCTIPRDTVIPILEQGSLWCKTVYNERTGFVMAKYLTFTGSSASTPAPSSTATPAPATGSAYAQITTAGGSLNLRASASGTARVLRTIPQGAVIPILEQGPAWCKTVYGSDTGYVMTQFLTFIGDSVPTATPAPTAPPQPETGSAYARVTTASGSLNLRASASGSARVLCTIPQYAVIPILEQGAVWCKTVYANHSGYVMTAFLTFTDDGEAAHAVPTPTAAPTAAPASGDAPYAQVTTPSGSLNLRAAARDTARVLRTIPQFDYVTVLQWDSHWCRVTYAGTTGYAMRAFLTPRDSLPAPAPTVIPGPTSTPAGLTARVNTGKGSLNLRAAARDTARVLTTIPLGATVQVTQYGADWCQVRYSGKTGYVMTGFLAFDGGLPTVTPTPAADGALQPLAAPITGRVVSTSGSLNLRAACSASAAVLTEIPRGDYVVITAVSDAWCAVEYEGVAGFCMSKYLEYPRYD